MNRSIQALVIYLFVASAISGCSSSTPTADVRAPENSQLSTPDVNQEIQRAVKQEEQRSVDLLKELLVVVDVVGQTSLTGDRSVFRANTEDQFKYTTLDKRTVQRSVLLRSIPTKEKIESIKYSNPVLLSDYDGDAMIEFIKTTKSTDGKLQVMKMNAYFRKEDIWRIRWEKEIERIK